MTKLSKEQDVKYKEQGEPSNASNELSAVVQYLAESGTMCIAKDETYEEKVRRRADESPGSLA